MYMFVLRKIKPNISKGRIKLIPPSSVLFPAEREPLIISYMTFLVRQVSSGAALNTLEPRHDKTNKMSVRPAKTQISLCIRPVWSESSICAQWVAKDPRFLHADSEDSDQTRRMPRLNWVFAGRSAILLVLSCRGSFCWDVLVTVPWNTRPQFHILACSLNWLISMNKDITQILI